jgi:hypothetical protein
MSCELKQFRHVVPLFLLETQKETKMQKVSSLNDLFRDYSGGTMDRKRFEGLLFQYVMENHHRFQMYIRNQDDYDEFLSWLYPRMRRAIDSYRETGASFETYIGALIRWGIKEYHARRTHRHITEHSTWKIRSSELAAHDLEPEYLAASPPPKTIRNPRQVLFLLLKSYYFVSDDFIARAAPRIGVEKEKLMALVTRMRKLRARRDEALRNLQERSYGQFYRCMAYERRLKAAPEGSACYRLLEIRLARAKRRLASIRRRLSRVRKEATNAQIAEILKIPKGTVDASFFALKKMVRQQDEDYPDQGPCN